MAAASDAPPAQWLRFWRARRRAASVKGVVDGGEACCSILRGRKICTIASRRWRATRIQKRAKGELLPSNYTRVLGSVIQRSIVPGRRTRGEKAEDACGEPGLMCASGRCDNCSKRHLSTRNSLGVEAVGRRQCHKFDTGKKEGAPVGDVTRLVVHSGAHTLLVGVQRDVDLACLALYELRRRIPSAHKNVAQPPPAHQNAAASPPRRRCRTSVRSVLSGRRHDAHKPCVLR